MSVDPSAVGYTSPSWTRSWTSTDTVLYALGVGAGRDELAYVTENSEDVPQRVVPTFAAVAAGGSAPVSGRLGSWAPEAKVHAGQEIRWHQPLRPDGSATLRARITAVTDKGTGALCEVSTSAVDESGAALFDSVSRTFIRGAGGFGAVERSAPKPSAEFHEEFAVPVADNQALIYRLSGDRNPLHSDPVFAARAGFPQPILHGLCTYGLVVRELVARTLDGDEARVRSYSVRLRAPVYPGEGLRVRLKCAGGRTEFVVSQGDRVVLDEGLLEAA